MLFRSRKLSAIAGQAEKQKVVLHELALFSLEQGLLHGNNNPAQAMLDKLPNSLNKRGLVAWLKAFGPFNIEAGVVKSGKVSRKQTPEAFIEQAKAMPFWEFSSADADDGKEEFDFQSQYFALIARAKASGLPIKGADLLAQQESLFGEETKAEIEKRIVANKKRNAKKTEAQA